MLPPCRSVTVLAMARPRPLPLWLWSGTRKKRSKTRWRQASAMPGPRSRTWSTAWSPWRCRRTLMVACAGLYLMALSTRLSISETRPSRSPITLSGSLASRASSTGRRQARASSAASRSSSSRSRRSGCMAMPGASVSLRMSCSSWATMRLARWLLRSRLSMSSCWRGSLPRRSRASTLTCMAASGVRSSWAASAMRLRSRSLLERTRASRALMSCTSGRSSACGGA